MEMLLIKMNIDGLNKWNLYKFQHDYHDLWYEGIDRDGNKYYRNVIYIRVYHLYSFINIKKNVMQSFEYLTTTLIGNTNITALY